MVGGEASGSQIHQPPGSLVAGIYMLGGSTPLASPTWWKEKGKGSCSVMSDLFATPWTVAYQAPRPLDFPGKSIGVGCLYLVEDSVSAKQLKDIVMYIA